MMQRPAVNSSTAVEEAIQQLNRSSQKELKLVNFSLQIVPSSIFSLTRLHELDLSKNQLKTLPLELNQLQNLQALYLNENQLTELNVECFKSLNNLEVFEASDNKITEIPDRLYISKPFLQHLDLSNNQIERIPGTGYLSSGSRNSKSFYKCFAYSHSGELTMLPELMFLNLSGNLIKVIPKTIKNLQVCSSAAFKILLYREEMKS